MFGKAKSRGARPSAAVVVALTVACTAWLPAQEYTQYGPFRVTPGRWHGVGLRLRKGERFTVVSEGAMQGFNRRFDPNGFTSTNGTAGKLHALTGSNAMPVGTGAEVVAEADAELELAVLFYPQVYESDATVTTGAFYAWVTAPAGRCPTANCGFTNTTGADLPEVATGGAGGGGAGNVANWWPNMNGVALMAYHLQNAEMTARMNPSGASAYSYVDQALVWAWQGAQSAQIRTEGLDQIIRQLRETRNPASVSSQLSSLTTSMTRILSRTCVCNGKPSNPGWVWEAGRFLAGAEYRVYANADAAAIYSDARVARDACASSGILSVAAMDTLLQAINARRPSNELLHHVRTAKAWFFSESDQQCTCY